MEVDAGVDAGGKSWREECRLAVPPDGARGAGGRRRGGEVVDEGGRWRHAGQWEDQALERKELRFEVRYSGGEPFVLLGAGLVVGGRKRLGKTGGRVLRGGKRWRLLRRRVAAVRSTVLEVVKPVFDSGNASAPDLRQPTPMKSRRGKKTTHPSMRCRACALLLTFAVFLDVLDVKSNTQLTPAALHLLQGDTPSHFIFCTSGNGVKISILPSS